MAKPKLASSLVDALTQRQVLRDAPLVGIDAGCRGGLPKEWRRFSPALVAHGIDPLIGECQRLQSEEPLATVLYHARFAGLPTDRRPASDTTPQAGSSLWARLSTARAVELLRGAGERRPEVPDELASPTSCIALETLAREQHLDYVDALKIDVDGTDFQVLQSAGGLLSQVLWIKIEVNFFGSAAPDANTFHNVDRYLRQSGFALFGLTARSYSRSALPARFLTRAPAHTASGAPLQGHALYARDLASGEQRLVAADLSIVRIAKLAALFELHGLPDCAAELLTVFEDRWREILDPEAALDALASNVVPGMRYAEYLEAFDREPLAFPPATKRESALETRVQGAEERRRERVASKACAEHDRASASSKKSKTRLQAAERAVAELTRRCDRLQRRLEIIEASTTWRVTSPWRRLRQVLTSREPPR